MKPIVAHTRPATHSESCAQFRNVSLTAQTLGAPSLRLFPVARVGDHNPQSACDVSPSIPISSSSALAKSSSVSTPIVSRGARRHINIDPVIQQPQLLQPLHPLNPRSRQRRKPLQRRLPIGINPQVLAIARKRLPIPNAIPIERNRSPREIKRPPIQRRDHLHRVGVSNLLRRAADSQRSDLNLGPLEQRQQRREKTPLSA
jgi:hypothetical protein